MTLMPNFTEVARRTRSAPLWESVIGASRGLEPGILGFSEIRLTLANSSLSLELVL